MKKNRKIILGLIMLVLATALVVDIFFYKVVRIGAQNFVAKLPSARADYARGLGGRPRLCAKCAMLFIFPQKGIYAFWMKDMQFDLDILWIADGEIVHIEKNFSADSPVTARPEVRADSVLEIGAGLSDRFDFKVGDRVIIY